MSRCNPDSASWLLLCIEKGSLSVCWVIMPLISHHGTRAQCLRRRSFLSNFNCFQNAFFSVCMIILGYCTHVSVSEPFIFQCMSKIRIFQFFGGKKLSKIWHFFGTFQYFLYMIFNHKFDCFVQHWFQIEEKQCKSRPEFHLSWVKTQISDPKMRKLRPILTNLASNS